MTSWYEEPMIAYDHSQTSKITLHIFLELKAHFSKAHILHVFNPDKSGYTPSYESSQAITAHFKQLFPQNHKENITIEMRPQGAKTVNDSILESFISSNSTVLFLGFYGMKGPKPRRSDLSSRVSQFVYESKLTLALVKRQAPKTSHVVYCFDGSQISINGLLKANEFCKTYGKRLTVVHCSQPSLKTHLKHVRNIIKQLRQTHGKELQQFQFLVEEESSLVDWLGRKENDFEWVVVTANGERGSLSKKRFVGSTTSQVLHNVNINMILLRQ